MTDSEIAYAKMYLARLDASEDEYLMLAAICTRFAVGEAVLKYKREQSEECAVSTDSPSKAR